MKSAAIFDLDGTLVPGTTTERQLLRHLLRRGTVTPLDMFRAASVFLAHCGDWGAMVLRNKSYLKGKRQQAVERLARDFFRGQAARLVHEQMRSLVEEHRARRDLVVLISGSFDFVLDVFRQELGCDEARGCELETRDGLFTGRALRHPYGEEKVAVLGELAEQHGIDLDKSTAYADHHADRFLLEEAGTAVCVNPDRKLRAYATQRRWQIIDTD